MTGQQLKNSILQMAIQGKLVPQDPHDEPASVLLERIREEKKRLVKEGVLKKKDLEEIPISEEEIPFDIPNSWVWCKLSTIASVYGGKRIPAGSSLTTINTGYKYIRVTDMKNGSVRMNDIHYITEDIYQQIKAYTISKSDLYITVAGTIGAVGEIPEALDMANLTENADKIVFSITNKRFLMYLLQSDFIQSQIKSYTTKVGQPKLAINKIQNFLLPLPPLAEQRRIVEKLESLMPLIESYGKSQEALNTLNASLPEKLRQSILQEAIQGHLVPQDPNEEPVSVLLERIRAEKARLVKEGKLKKKDLEEKPISPDEIPFDIPEGWVWCRLGDIGDWGAGATPFKGNPNYYDGDVLWLRTGELNNDVVYDTEIKITETALKECSLRLNKIGDVLIAMYGATIGKVAIVGAEMTTNQACCACSPICIFNWYLFYFLMASKSEFIKKGEGGAQPNISRDKLINHLFPLPPLSEQRRIVTKLEELLQEIDKLKA